MFDGVNPEHIVLIDNSEKLEVENFLLDFLPEGIHFLSTENKGFGNAANIGLDYINYIENSILTAAGSLITRSHMCLVVTALFTKVHLKLWTLGEFI